MRLDAYRVALELFAGVERVCARFPRGHRELKDQLRRAAGAVVRHIAEGASRLQPRDKSARFVLARGECSECAASLDMAAIVGVLGEGDHDGLVDLCDRINAMTWRLIRPRE